MPQHRIVSALSGKRGKWTAGVAAVAAVSAVSAPLVWSGLSDRAEAEAAGTALKGPAGTHPQADFDKDGRADQVSPSPNGEVSGSNQAGFLAVTYGSDKPGEGRRQVVDQTTSDVPGKPVRAAQFGADSTARDFDGDGYTDLAVTAGRGKASVILLWGSEKGLRGGTYLKNASGSPIAAVGGDFDGDGKADLVTGFGAKGLVKGPFTRAGGAAGTASVPEPRIKDEEGDDIPNPSLEAAGDLNGDRTDDLVTLTTNETDDNTNHVVWASRYLQGGKDGFAEPVKSHIPGNGAATVGDVDNDGYGDLIVGRRGAERECGDVTVVHGSSHGPGSRQTTVTKDSPGVPGEAGGACDYTSLDGGDVDGDGYADVLAGATLDFGSGQQKGAATLLRGGPNGLSGNGAQRFTAKSFGASPSSSSGAFGSAVNLLDMDGDGKSDVTLGDPDRNEMRGALWVIPGTGGAVPEKDAVSLTPKDFELSEGTPLLGSGATDVRGS
ncbi:FG-GAP repeat domain-containing protein [Streptomyces armeniacus]|uniref:FG-GAP repeat domain-containing protein n=1 Tax=Streptomyces armeniacus TaxID=83291 RepID=UPI001AD84405|nr:VCBS repeat-containing protein [Streptomyces armeniacus]